MVQQPPELKPVKSEDIEWTWVYYSMGQVIFFTSIVPFQSWWATSLKCEILVSVMIEVLIFLLEKTKFFWKTLTFSKNNVQVFLSKQLWDGTTIVYYNDFNLQGFHFQSPALYNLKHVKNIVGWPVFDISFTCSQCFRILRI